MKKKTLIVLASLIVCIAVSTILLSIAICIILCRCCCSSYNCKKKEEGEEKKFDQHANPYIDMQQVDSDDLSKQRADIGMLKSELNYYKMMVQENDEKIHTLMSRLMYLGEKKFDQHANPYIDMQQVDSDDLSKQRAGICMLKSELNYYKMMVQKNDEKAHTLMYRLMYLGEQSNFLNAYFGRIDHDVDTYCIVDRSPYTRESSTYTLRSDYEPKDDMHRALRGASETLNNVTNTIHDIRDIMKR